VINYTRNVLEKKKLTTPGKTCSRKKKEEKQPHYHVSKVQT